jgi:predicted ATPase
MGVHTGEASIVSTGLVGYQVHKAARIAAVSHGGQVVLSASTTELVRDSMPEGSTVRVLGSHRLKDLGRPEELYQLVIEGMPSEFAPLRSLSNPELRHNLPLQLSSFVGREAELEEIRALLSASRLVTLTGPGGCGKTRLALQVAADLLDGSGGGVWFVDLASLRDERFVAERMASVLGVREDPGIQVADSLARWISGQAMLVLLDNCEHLVEACAKLTDRLLRACPNLAILATSREALGVDGERPYRIPSLGLPGSGHFDVATVGESEAVQLLVERAKVHEPGFAVNDANAEAVAAICARLDGIPLALELVAARLSVMTPADVERRLDDRFRLLTGSSRTALPRQQTLLASLDWSFDLLDPAQRSVLRRLSVFVGSFDVAASETVCAAADVEVYEVAEVVEGLVDRSLLHAEQVGVSRRIRMSESVREYAGRKLLELSLGELALARERHASHYDAIAKALPPMHDLQPLSLEAELAEAHRLAMERGNVRAALDLSLGNPDDVDRSLRLSELYARCEWSVGSPSEFVELIEPYAERFAHGDPWWRALVECSLGNALLVSGRPQVGETHLRHAKSIGLGSNLHAAVMANEGLAFIAVRRGDYAHALALADEGVTLVEASGDADLMAWSEVARAQYASYGDSSVVDSIGRAAAHFLRRGMEKQYWECIAMLAAIELRAGNEASSREHFEAALTSGATGRNEWEGVTHLNLSLLRLIQGDVRTSTEHWFDGADMIERNHWGTYFPAVLMTGALCCSATGHSVAAVRLHGAATQAIEDLGDEIEPFFAKLRTPDLVKLRSTMGDQSFEHEFAEGREMTFESATTLSRGALRS